MTDETLERVLSNAPQKKRATRLFKPKRTKPRTILDKLRRQQREGKK